MLTKRIRFVLSLLAIAAAVSIGVLMGLKLDSDPGEAENPGGASEANLPDSDAFSEQVFLPYCGDESSRSALKRCARRMYYDLLVAVARIDAELIDGDVEEVTENLRRGFDLICEQEQDRFGLCRAQLAVHNLFRLCSDEMRSVDPDPLCEQYGQ